MTETPVAIALVALIGTLAAGFFKLLADQNKTHAKISDGLRELTKAGDNQAEAIREVGAIGEIGNREATERNGHLGEQNTKIIKLIKSTHKNILLNIKEQHVNNQSIEHQTVLERKEK